MRDEILGHAHEPNGPTPKLREACGADRASLVDLWVAAWCTTMPDIDFDGRRIWFHRHLEALQGSGARILVAEVGGMPLGFVTVDPGRRHLDQLAVHPDGQGSGVASLLIAAAKALSPAGLVLDVNRDNPRARRLYAGHGFSELSAGRNPTSGLPTLRLGWPGTDRGCDGPG
jgi:ribosomal protein S18 acetylase RimI-like enzyme